MTIHHQQLAVAMSVTVGLRDVGPGTCHQGGRAGNAQERKFQEAPLRK
jgi:hypothetical protein